MSILLTGFPGFLGSALLPRLLATETEPRAICLVQSRWGELARRRRSEILNRRPGLKGRIELVEGDITKPGLGLGGRPGLADEVEEIHHLAAVYDLAVSRDRGMRVNVDGTLHVLQLAERCRRLRRFHYVSTCYVSGRHPGRFREDDLDVGQTFNNAYEETKFLAEVEVRFWMEQGLPGTVYRPAIVVGDRGTGATQKYDGPYYLIRLLLRQPRVALVPVVGDPEAHRVNVVPRDFVVDALAYLASRPSSIGRTYHLADPDPITVAGLLEAAGRATGRRLVRVPVPRRLAKGLLERVPGLSGWLGFPPEALDYFTHPTRYDTARAEADLAESGIGVPSLPSYVDRLVDFVRRHPEAGTGTLA